jgi:hypothetical protein
MFSTPLICLERRGDGSAGTASRPETAPTTTDGGTISGYSEIGS